MGRIRIVDSNKEMDENHWSVIMKKEYTERLANKTIEELVAVSYTHLTLPTSYAV